MSCEKPLWPKQSSCWSIFLTGHLNILQSKTLLTVAFLQYNTSDRGMCHNQLQWWACLLHKYILVLAFRPSVTSITHTVHTGAMSGVGRRKCKYFGGVSLRFINHRLHFFELLFWVSLQRSDRCGPSVLILTPGDRWIDLSLALSLGSHYHLCWLPGSPSARAGRWLGPCSDRSSRWTCAHISWVWPFSSGIS